MSRLACPHCKATFPATFGQPGAVVYCPECGFVIKEGAEHPGKVIPVPPAANRNLQRPPEAVKQWLYAKNKQKLGPVSLLDLRRLLGSGQLSATDMVLKAGTKKWVAVGSLPELKPSAAPRPPAPSPVQASKPSVARTGMPGSLPVAGGAPGAVKEWYYAKGRQKLGPVSLPELKALSVAGKLNPNDLLLKTGSQKWVAASSIADLFPPALAPVPKKAVVAPAAVAGPETWFYAKNKQKVGPVPVLELKRLVAAGELTPSDLILKAGTPRWVPVASMPELAPPLPAVVPSLPPAPMPIPQPASAVSAKEEARIPVPSPMPAVAQAIQLAAAVVIPPEPQPAAILPSKPLVEEPVAAEPLVEQPVVAEPLVEEPVAAEPLVEEPVAAEPLIEEPVAAEPLVEEPVAAEPLVEEMVVAEPQTEEVSAAESYSDDAVQEPLRTESVLAEPTLEEDSAPEPLVERIVVTETTLEVVSAPGPLPGENVAFGIIREETVEIESQSEEVRSSEPLPEEIIAADPQPEESGVPEPPIAEYVAVEQFAAESLAPETVPVEFSMGQPDSGETLEPTPMDAPEASASAPEEEKKPVVGALARLLRKILGRNS